MTIDTIYEDPRWERLDLETLAEKAADAALSHLGYAPDDFEAALLACDDARIQTLNDDFRDKDKPTNVLSWPSYERGAEQAGDPPVPLELPEDAELGDIAISYDTCAREAVEAGKSMADHVTHLIVHGMLHLLGYDHIRDADATLMEGIEVQILGKLGIPDPY